MTKRIRRTKRQRAGIKNKIKKMIADGVSVGDMADKLKMSERHVIRLKNQIKKPVEKSEENVDPSLNKQKTKQIDKSLNPIEFVDKYLEVKPNKIQRLIIKAFYGLHFNQEEHNIMLGWQKEGKTTWEETKKYKELVLIIGMKGGKTTLIAMFALIEEYLLYCMGRAWEKYKFTPGKEVYIMNVATNKEQARDTIFAEIKASIDRSPYFKKRNPYEVGNSFRFNDTNVIMKSGHSNSSSLAGKLLKFVGLDELDRFKTSGGKYSANEVYKVLNRSTDPFREDGHIASISSLVNEKGKMVELFLKSKEIKTMLGFWLPEWEMQQERYKMYQEGSTKADYFLFNSLKIPIEHKDEFDKDPEGFLRDKACILGFTKGRFFRMPEKIDEAFQKSNNEGYKNGIDELNRFLETFRPVPGRKYFIHGDPSLNHDCYWFGMGHREGNRKIIDLIYRMEPTRELGEVDAEEVKKFILSIYDLGFNIEEFTYDIWAISDLTQAIKKRGKKANILYIRKEQYDLLKDNIYADNFRCPIVGGKIENVNYKNVFEKEAKELEVVGDKVDHPAGGSKDCVDVVAGVVWNCQNKDSGVMAGFSTSGEDSEKESENILPKRRKLWERTR